MSEELPDWLKKDQDAITEKFNEVRDAVLHKNKDWQSAVFRSDYKKLPPSEQIMVLIFFKLKRMTTKQKTFEPLDDTIFDLIGYGIEYFVAKERETGKMCPHILEEIIEKIKSAEGL